MGAVSGIFVSPRSKMLCVSKPTAFEWLLRVGPSIIVGHARIRHRGDDTADGEGHKQQNGKPHRALLS